MKSDRSQSVGARFSSALKRDQRGGEGEERGRDREKGERERLTDKKQRQLEADGENRSLTVHPPFL